jgi:predicted SnoaL-like aldol condensation-catalyzing enzyme
MKKMVWAATAAVLAFSTSAIASEKTDQDGIKTENGKIIADYFKMFFTECNRAGANKKYYHPNAIEHGWLGNGSKEPTMAEMEAMAAQSAGQKCEPGAEMLKLVVQGDLVFVLAHGFQSKPGGDLLWILYRIKDGKIYEHWDTHNEIPAAQIGKQW